jgi:hypothetical protein
MFIVHIANILFFLILQFFHTQVSSVITYSLTDRDSHKTWLWVGIVLFFQQPRDIEKEGKKDVLYVSISGYYTITLCGTTAGGPTPVLTLYFFASSTVVLRSFFAFKAKNDRRTSGEEAEKHRVSTGVGQPAVMPQGG